MLRFIRSASGWLAMERSVFWCLLVFSAGVWGEDSDVMELDGVNFKDSIADLDTVLVEFYAPWSVYYHIIASVLH